MFTDRKLQLSTATGENMETVVSARKRTEGQWRFGNLLVMMKSQSLELDSVKNRFGGRRLQ